MIGRDNLIATLLELQRVSAGAAGNLEQFVDWPIRILAETLIDERCFRLVRFVSVKEIVKFRVSA